MFDKKLWKKACSEQRLPWELNQLKILLTLRNLPKYKKKKLFSGIEDGYYKYPRNCLVLADERLSTAYSWFLSPL